MRKRFLENRNPRSNRNGEDGNLHRAVNISSRSQFRQHKLTIPVKPLSVLVVTIESVIEGVSACSNPKNSLPRARNSILAWIFKFESDSGCTFFWVLKGAEIARAPSSHRPLVCKCTIISATISEIWILASNLPNSLCTFLYRRLLERRENWFPYEPPRGTSNC